MEQVHQNKTVLAFWKISNGLNGKVNKGKKSKIGSVFTEIELERAANGG